MNPRCYFKIVQLLLAEQLVKNVNELIEINLSAGFLNSKQSHHKVR